MPIIPILQPGAIDDDGNWLDPDVMARYMEDALPPPEGEDSGRAGRRAFFIAISSGVIDYLRKHSHDGFEDGGGNVVFLKFR